MIYNLTQHSPTAVQKEIGVGEPMPGCRELLTFTTPPTVADIQGRAAKLASLVAAEANQGDKVMIGGAPYLMGQLAANLKELCFVPVFSFTERRSVETVINNVTTKTSVFEHVCWVAAV